MNGISAVVLATGNDTRAVEAGAPPPRRARRPLHRAVAFETRRRRQLVGTLEMPMAVGLVGGATKVHPAARAAVAVLGVDDGAASSPQVIVAVGLAQNLGALRALATEGIQRGHMSLHARNVAISAGAEGEEVDAVVQALVAEGGAPGPRRGAACRSARGRSV